MDKKKLDDLLIGKMVLYVSHMGIVGRFKTETYLQYKERVMDCARPLLEQMKELMEAQTKEEFNTRIDLLGEFAKTQDKEIIRLKEKVMKLRMIIRSIIIWSKEKLNEL